MANRPEDTAQERPSGSRFIVGACYAIAAVAIWAGWLVMMRLGVTTTLSAPDLTALRFATAGPLLLPVVLRRGLAIDRLGWPGLAAVVIGAGAPVALIIGFGMRFAPVAHAGVLYQGIVPLAVACLAAAVLQERITAIRKVGLLFVIVGGSIIGGLGVTAFEGRQTVGHLLFLTAACMTACYTLAVRRAQIDGLHAAAIAAVVSWLAYLPIYIAFVEDGLFSVPLSDLELQALYQGVLTATVSLALYGHAIRLLGASNAAAFVALGPVMAALMAIPALEEWPSRVDWGAIAIIAAGVYFASGAPTFLRGGGGVARYGVHERRDQNGKNAG
jgi:drug/metabolite transporter (DMT)-like permease